MSNPVQQNVTAFSARGLYTNSRGANCTVLPLEAVSIRDS
jgi:hypothetical protein